MADYYKEFIGLFWVGFRTVPNYIFLLPLYLPINSKTYKFIRTKTRFYQIINSINALLLILIN